MPRPTFLRVLIAALLVVITAAAVAANLPGASGSEQVQAGNDPTAPAPEAATLTDSNPPTDAEQVLAEGERVAAFAAAVDQFQADQAAFLAAATDQQRQDEEAAALRTLARAVRAADAADATPVAPEPAPEAAPAEATSGDGTAPDSYWDRMAACETGGNWGMVGSRYSGGVGFYNGTWDTWGGREFASRAGYATREQQIIVANRIAVLGWEGPNGYVSAVGYSGWGCVRSIGYP